jgi:hypothetical protein
MECAELGILEEQSVSIDGTDCIPGYRWFAGQAGGDCG